MKILSKWYAMEKCSGTQLKKKKITMIFNIAETMTKQKVNKITSPASPV